VRAGGVFRLLGSVDTDSVDVVAFRDCSGGCPDRQNRFRCLLKMLVADEIFDINHSPFVFSLNFLFDFTLDILVGYLFFL